jgi:hypothetical protein
MTSSPRFPWPAILAAGTLTACASGAPTNSSGDDGGPVGSSDATAFASNDSAADGTVDSASSHDGSGGASDGPSSGSGDSSVDGRADSGSADGGSSGASDGGSDAGSDAPSSGGGDASPDGAGDTGSSTGGSDAASDAPSSGGSDGSVDGAGDGSQGGSDSGLSEAGDASDDGAGSCAANAQYPQTSFVNLAPPMGAPLNRSENDAIPGDAGVSPQGWNFYQIGGAMCRDGSPNGFYVRYTTSTKLMIYLEGGGACSSQHFCDHNPANLNQIFPGGSATEGQTIGGSLLTVAGLQQPYTTGIFDNTNSANPFQTWNEIYIPYCTGDVHFGTLTNVTIPGVTAPQQFVGYLNMQKFIGRIVPTFPNLDQVVLSGASAGGFAAGLNFGMVQDAFGSVPVTVLDDSGPPFSSQYLAPCLQKQWRDTWGFDAALPSDCAECTQPDGGGLTNIVYYWLHKYPRATVGLVSTVQDEVMRLFFGAGDNNCATNDPNLLALSPYPAAQYEQGLMDLRTTFACTGRLATYYIAGANPTYHQHIFRQADFFGALAGNVTMAAWTSDLVNGRITQVGP